MARLALALLSMILFAGMASVLVPEARAAAAVCDAAACISKYCKGAIAGNAQRCNSNCLITAAENKKRGCASSCYLPFCGLVLGRDP
jgi:hypothetical protein